MGSKITSNKSTPGSWSIGPPNVAPKLLSNPFEQNDLISQPTFAHLLFFQTTKLILVPFFLILFDGPFRILSFEWTPRLVDTIAVGKIIEDVENLFDDSDDLRGAAKQVGWLKPTWDGAKAIAGWWFQPWKIWSSTWESSPNRVEHKKYLKPPPGL